MIHSLLLAICLTLSLAWPADALAGDGGSPGQAGHRVAEQADSAARPQVGAEAPVRPLGQSPAATAGGPVPEYRLGAPTDDRGALWDGMRMLLSLGAVLLLLGFGVKLLRRWRGVGAPGGGHRTLHVLERVALSPKETVCLLRAGSEVLVIGVSASGIALLTRLEAGLIETGVPASGAMPSPRISARPSPFGSRLRELAARVREVQEVWGLGGGGAGDRP